LFTISKDPRVFLVGDFCALPAKVKNPRTGARASEAERLLPAKVKDPCVSAKASEAERGEW